MKKYLVLFLILLPLLTSCRNQEPEQSQSTAQTVVTLPPAYYEESSEIEVATGGAVKQFALPGGGYVGVFRVGNGILLATDGEASQLQMLTGETCIPSVTAALSRECLQQCVALSDGFAYYDPQAHSVLYLDANLSQKHCVALTSDMQTPVISPDGNLIFYCIGQEIRVLDVEKNISRLVKSQEAAKQTLVGTCFRGSMLVCVVEDSSGGTETRYISTKDGQTLRVENGISRLYTNENHYLAKWSDGSLAQWVCGTLEGAAQCFIAGDAELFDAMELGGVVGYGATETGLSLNFYTIPTGKKTAQLTLDGIAVPECFLADPQSGSVWMIAKDPDGEGKILLKWELEKSPCTEETEFVEALYTANSPDKRALEELQDRVEALNSKHGVRIRIWQEAVKAPGDHVLVPEHQPEVIRDMLDQLEAVLKEFPKKFVYKSISSRVRICLIRSIDGKSQGQQYWDGRYAFITLCSGSDLREDFLKGFGLVVDSHVLGNSPVYDYWDTLNPEGFRYGKPDEAFVTGETRYFVDVDSMTSGMMDRSRIFWQAMKADNAELFQSETMQKKLKMLCKAIRDAWDLEMKSDIYPWEQYLKKPIAYKK